jgi:hypothetical protein
MQKLMKDLIEILTWCRGAGTKSEAAFVREHIASIDGIWPDEYGNYHLTIGSEPTVMWSSHTDTVTRKEGRQNVKWIGKGILGLNNGQQGQCLGADDGAGVWLMLEMIKEGKPGHYVFHREEEIGGLGSTWISKNAYVLPQTLKCAIAMDRCGTRDIITHQAFSRSASDEFAFSLGRQLGHGFIPDDTGVFTDTANYIDIIGECTNLSVGYERNHGPSETLDTNHLRRLRDSLMKLDISALEFSRKPGDYDMGAYYGSAFSQKSSKSYGGGWIQDEDDEDIWNNYHGETGGRTSVDGSPLDHTDEGGMDMTDMVNEAPEVAARLIEELGVSRDEFRAHVFALTGRLLGG